MDRFMRHFGAPMSLRYVIDGESDGGAPDATPDATPTPEPEPGKTFTQAELDKLVEQRLTRERKKYGDYDALKAAASELEAIKAASATDLEKAVKLARDEERASIVKDYGAKLARGVLRAQLSARMKPAEADALIEDLNLGKYVGDDGEIDEAAIAATVARIAPAAQAGPVDLGQGSRGDGPSLERQIADAQKRGDWAAAIALKASALQPLAP